jgi:hypothetical protein
LYGFTIYTSIHKRTAFAPVKNQLTMELGGLQLEASLSKKLSKTFSQKTSWAWCCVSIISGTEQIEVEGS